MTNMCKIKDLPQKTNGLLSQYMGRKLFLEGKIKGCRLGSIILVNLESVEQYFKGATQESGIEQQGKIRKIY